MSFRYPLTLLRISILLLAASALWLTVTMLYRLTDVIRFR